VDSDPKEEVFDDVEDLGVMVLLRIAEQICDRPEESSADR
jgi:hypothetical protein